MSVRVRSIPSMYTSIYTGRSVRLSICPVVVVDLRDQRKVADKLNTDLLPLLHDGWHNIAARMALKLLLAGSHGNCYILADVGSTSRLGDLAALDARLPDWLVSDSDLMCEGLGREALRPDILITTAQPPLP